jgi:hypothetical protein
MTTEPHRRASPDDSKLWESLAPWERAAAWESESPGTAAEMIRLIILERSRRHRLAWADMVKQFLGVVLGFGCVLVLSAVAWHYVDRGEAVAGAAFAGSGMAATVAIFVTGKYLSRRR